MKNTIEILDKFKFNYEIKGDKIYLEYYKISLSNNNLIGCLDVSMIENLDTLWCEGNKLTKIICNEKLKELYCYKNNLTEIVCNNKLKNLYCHNNPILKLNRNNIKHLKSDIYIYDDKYYFNNKEITDITFKNDKKIMRTDDKIFLIENNYPIEISDIELFKRSKKHYINIKQFLHNDVV